MLTTIRSNVSSWFVKILFALLIVSFALWGIGDMFREDAPDTVVAVAGEVEIDQRTLDNNFRQIVEARRFEAGGDYSTSQAIADGALDEALDGLIVEALVAQLVRDIGLTPGTEMMADQVRRQSAFQDPITGQFDRQRFLQTAAANGLTEAGYLDLMRRQLTQRAITLSVARAAWAPEILAEQLYAFAAEARLADTISIPLNSVQDLPEPSEQDLAAFHAENPEQFTAPEYRRMSAVIVNPSDFADEVAVDDEQLRAIYEDRLDEFEIPATRTLVQVSGLDEEGAAALSEAAQAEGSLAEAMAAEGAPEGELVEMGQVAQDELFGAMAEAAFQLDAGEISEPFEGFGGWTVIQATDATEATLRPFEEVAEELRRNVQLDRALDTVFALANRLEDAIAAGTSLEDAADIAALPVISLPPLAADGAPQGDAPADVPALPEIVAEGFTLAEGETSFLQETAEGAYFIVRTDEIIEPSLRPLTEVRAEAAEAWREAERRRLAGERAQEAAALLAQENDPAEAAEAVGGIAGETRPLLRDGSNRGTLPVSALRTLFGLEIGETAVVSTPTAEMAVRLTAINEANLAEAEEEIARSVRQRAENDIALDLLTQFEDALRQRYPVEIRQSVIDRQYAIL